MTLCRGGAGIALLLFFIFLNGTIAYTQTPASGLHFEPDDRIELNNFSDFNSNEFTIEAMCFVGSTGSSYKTIFHIGTATESYLEVYTQGTTRIAVVSNRNATGFSSRSHIVESYPLDQWFLLTLRFIDGQEIEVFYDGVPAPVLGGTGPIQPPAVTGEATGHIGHMPSNSFAQCCAPSRMDELRIWNRRLSDDEMNHRLSCEIDGSEDGLYAYYSFNQGEIGANNTAITTLVDQTGNGHDGDLINFILTGSTSNWSEGADIITGECLPFVLGCTDEAACNYNTEAMGDDGSCLFAEGCDFCSGETDGSGSVVDGDINEDGICDLEQTGCQDETACNYDPEAALSDDSCVYAEFGYDCDGNMIDSDEDGIFDIFEGDNDSDGDSVPDYLDPDDDGDGIPTNLEIGVGYNAADNTGILDSDGDGIADYLDTDDDGDSIPTSLEIGLEFDGQDIATVRDTDADGVPDFLDTDDDGDGIPTFFELGNEFDGQDIATARDTDADGAPDFLDSDDDGDGLPTAEELGAAYNPSDNTGAADTAGEGIPDYLNPDILGGIDQLGCTNSMASNFDPEATIDDGSCSFDFCGEGTYFDEEVGQCLPVVNDCDSDINGDGQVNVSDLLLFLGSFGSSCN